MRNDFHKSVLLKETLDFLQIEEGKKYIDATLGGGGHSREILIRGGIVLGIDQDQDAINFVRKNFKNNNLKLSKGNFRNIDKIAKLEGFGRVKGIIYDLGVSSFQIGSKERGFSFQDDTSLDMRMDKAADLPKASDILNLATENELSNIFFKFGEERRSRAIASAVVGARVLKAFETTTDLLKVLKEVYGLEGEITNKTRANIAKRVFQALRIAVNNELGSLENSLPRALTVLEPGGRMVVISFHSLEDRIVKDIFIEFEKQKFGKILTKKPLLPMPEEISINPRARSAKLRVFEKL